MRIANIARRRITAAAHRSCIALGSQGRPQRYHSLQQPLVGQTTSPATCFSRVAHLTSPWLIPTRSLASASGGGSEDPFQVLEVSRDASQDEIKTAYRRLALKWHPDRNPDKPAEAEAKFKQVSKAYSILSDPESRERYKRFGSAEGPFGQGGAGTWQQSGQARTMSQEEAEEIFRQMFGKKPLHQIIREVEQAVNQQQEQMMAQEDQLRNQAARLQMEISALEMQASQERNARRRQTFLAEASRKAGEARRAQELLQLAQLHREERKIQAMFAMNNLRRLDPVLQAENQLRRGLSWGAALGSYFLLGTSLIGSVFVLLSTSIVLRFAFQLLRNARR